MTNEKDNNIFDKFLKGVKPIPKSNKLSKPIPKIDIKKSKELAKKEPTKENPTLTKKINFSQILKKNQLEKNQINKRLKKGKIPIDKKVDFHGLSVEEAKKIFIETINNSFLKRYRCLLFVTGKGTSQNKNENTKETKLYFGKIRSSFGGWLDLDEVSPYILNVQEANRENGGDGAFFIYLRKNKN